MLASRTVLVLFALLSQEGFAPLKTSPPRGESSRPAVSPGGASPLAARLSFPAVASAAARDRPTITVHSARRAAFIPVGRQRRTRQASDHSAFRDVVPAMRGHASRLRQRE